MCQNKSSIDFQRKLSWSNSVTSKYLSNLNSFFFKVHYYLIKLLRHVHLPTAPTALLQHYFFPSLIGSQFNKNFYLHSEIICVKFVQVEGDTIHISNERRRHEIQIRKNRISHYFPINRNLSFNDHSLKVICHHQLYNVSFIYN